VDSKEIKKEVAKKKKTLLQVRGKKPPRSSPHGNRKIGVMTRENEKRPARRTVAIIKDIRQKVQNTKDAREKKGA